MFDLYCFSDFKPSNLCLWYKKVISMQYSGICTFQHIPQVKGKYYSGIINMVNDLLLVGNVVNINILEIKIYIYNLFFQVLPKTFRSKDIKGFLCFSLNLNSRENIFSWFFTIFCFFFFCTGHIPFRIVSLCVLSVLLLLKYHFYFFIQPCNMISSFFFCC